METGILETVTLETGTLDTGTLETGTLDTGTLETVTLETGTYAIIRLGILTQKQKILSWLSIKNVKEVFGMQL